MKVHLNIRSDSTQELKDALDAGKVAAKDLALGRRYGRTVSCWLGVATNRRRKARIEVHYTDSGTLVINEV